MHDGRISDKPPAPSTGAPAASPSGKAKVLVAWLQTNQGAAAVLLLCFVGFLIYVAMQPETFRRLRDGFYLGFVPVASLLIMIICSLFIVFDKFRSEKYFEYDNKNLSISKLIFYAFIYIIFVLCYFVAFLYVGYVISTLFFMILTMLLLGIRSFSVIFWTTALTLVAVYAIFHVLNFSLPAGPFGF